MEVQCPSCQRSLMIDDAKIPAGAFTIQCPSCESSFSLQDEEATEKEAPPQPAAATAPSDVSSSFTDAGGRAPGDSGRALVALTSSTHTLALATTFEQAGFAVDAFDESDEQRSRLMQGDYGLVATDSVASADDTIAQLVARMPQDLRRHLFLVLVADHLATGDPALAFASRADLLLASGDLSSCGRLLLQVLDERQRLYQTYWDAEVRKLEGRL